MAVPFGLPTWPHLFTPGLCARVAASIPGMTTDRVFESVWADEDHLRFPPADRFVAVRGLEFPVDQRMVDGGGAYNTGFDSTLVTTLFVRVESDLEGRSTALLRDVVAGVYKTVQSLVSGLQTWPGPVDADSTMSHFRRPMRLAPGWRVLMKSASGQKDTRWAVVPVSWQVSFVGALGSPYTAL